MQLIASGQNNVTLVIDQPDTRLDYDNQCLIVHLSNISSRSFPLSGITKILCLTPVVLHSRLLLQCQAHGVDFVQLDPDLSENSFAVLSPNLSNVIRGIAHFQICSSPSLAIKGARRMMGLKLRVMCRVLADQNNEHLVSYLRSQIRRISSIACLKSLRDIDAQAQRAMLHHWQLVLPAGLKFQSHAHEFPPNPVNLVLSLCVERAKHEAVRQCVSHGLDSWLGFYHLPTEFSQALACDLVELVRPEIERWVVRTFWERRLDLRHFSLVEGVADLGPSGHFILDRTWNKQMPEVSRRLSRYAAGIARILEMSE